MAKKKKASKSPRTQNYLGEPIDELLRGFAKEAAGKPLSESLTPDSPLKQLIGRFVELTYEEEMNEHLGYERYKDTPSAPDDPQRNTRNGSYSKTLKTSLGTTQVAVPRDRKGEFSPRIVPKFQGISNELEARIVSMYSRGMTTRDIGGHIEEIYNFEASPMFVSRVVEKLEPELKAWRNRALESHYAIVFIDALHLKVRHSFGVRPTAAYQVCGYNESGRLEILGIAMAPTENGVAESASFWHQMLLEVKNRGVQEMLIVCGDGLIGLEQAVEAVFPRARFQPCVVHLTRNSFKIASYKHRANLARDLRLIYQAPTYEAAEMALENLAEQWNQRYPQIVAQWTQNLPRLANLWTYGAGLRKLVYTTNPIENVNRQLRKVTKTRGSMPTVESAIRLLTLAAMQISEKEQQKTRARPDWKSILGELHIHFADRLPKEWGHRFLMT